MHFRTFFFLLFILASMIFFLITYQHTLALELFGSMCQGDFNLNFIQLTSMIMSSISLVLFVVSSYYGERRVLREKKRLEEDRLNIEEIHAELEALKIRD